MNLDLADLRALRAVADAGGITAAARELRCVPSNVSTRIRQIEARLGVTLFQRAQRRVTPLPDGRALLVYADKILALVAEAEEALHARAPRGILHLGATECATVGFLPAPLAQFHRKYPDCQVHLESDSTAGLLRGLEAGELEAAVVVDGTIDTRFIYRRLARETLVWISQQGAPPIHKAEDMGQVTLLAFPDGCAYRERALRWFARQQAAPAKVAEMNNYHVLLACVAAGMGVALVPRSLVESSVARREIRCHVLSRSESSAPLSLVHRRGAESPRLTGLVECLVP